MPKIDRVIVSKRHARRMRNDIVNKLISNSYPNVNQYSYFTDAIIPSESNFISKSSNSIIHTAVNQTIVNYSEDERTSEEFHFQQDVCSHEFVNDTPAMTDLRSTIQSLPFIEEKSSNNVDAANSGNTNQDAVDFDDSNIELCSSDSSSYNSDLCGSNNNEEAVYSVTVNPTIFRNDLNCLISKHNATQDLTTDLLHLLKPVFPFLPNDARTLQETPKTTETIKLHNGEMCYFGVEACLRLKLQGYVLEGKVVSLDINIDGLPLFKSSSTEFWPILGRICSIDNQEPFTIAIFCGKGKPDPIDQYLQPFISEVKYLSANGMKHGESQYFIKIRCFSCDAPARSWLKCVKAHSAIAGCERCTVLATHKDRRLFYPSTFDCPERHDDDFRDHRKNHSTKKQKKRNAKEKRKEEQKKHILGKSPLLRVRSLGLISQFVLDPMHLLYLGVLKRLLIKYLVDGKRRFKLSKSQLKIIDQIIRMIRPFVSSDFVRKGRTLMEIKRWKATEFRLFLLYTGPVIMKDILDKKKYAHFLLFHVAITILSSSRHIDEYLEFAREALIKFVKQAAEIYEDEFVVYNVHSLPHIVDDVKKYGSLDSYSCFSFENHLKTLKMRVRSKKQPLQQISNRIHELNMIKNVKKSEVPRYQPSGITFPGDRGEQEQYFECASLKYHDFKISSKRPDNVVSANGNIYIIDKIFCVRGHYKCIGSPFKYLDNLYDKPLESSKLNIFYGKSFGQLSIFSVDDISFKCVRFPIQEGFAIFPIIHQLS